MSLKRSLLIVLSREMVFSSENGALQPGPYNLDSQVTASRYAMRRLVRETGWLLCGIKYAKQDIDCGHHDFFLTSGTYTWP
jgi:hypothetical protein